jgi:NAD(P)-dependent dehydrogenase (short-subunit alcohol dehydrogenase family)
MVQATSSPVWLITGCSSGIGRAIAEAALEHGDRVVVTARVVDRVTDLAARYPHRSLALPLDVTKAEQITRAVTQTEEAFGRIDVLVNNAGYGYLAAIEEGEDSEVRAMFETNYFGVVAMIKAVLPGMRHRRSGRIINISSMTGLVANPVAGYYASTKFALEALTEVLSKELQPFGIRVSAVEPGGFRTDYSGRSMKESRIIIEDYASTAGARRKLIRSVDGKQTGDPKKAAAAVLMLAQMPDPPLHLLLGRDVYAAFQAKLESLRENLAAWEAVTLGTDFPQGE